MEKLASTSICKLQFTIIFLSSKYCWHNRLQAFLQNGGALVPGKFACNYEKKTVTFSQNLSFSLFSSQNVHLYIS